MHFSSCYISLLNCKGIPIQCWGGPASLSLFLSLYLLLALIISHSLITSFSITSITLTSPLSLCVTTSIYIYVLLSQVLSGPVDASVCSRLHRQHRSVTGRLHLNGFTLACEGPVKTYDYVRWTYTMCIDVCMRSVCACDSQLRCRHESWHRLGCVIEFFFHYFSFTRGAKLFSKLRNIYNCLLSYPKVEIGKCNILWIHAEELW